MLKAQASKGLVSDHWAINIATCLATVFFVMLAERLVMLNLLIDTQYVARMFMVFKKAVHRRL